MTGTRKPPPSTTNLTTVCAIRPSARPGANNYGRELLPPHRQPDAGCGTGSLSLLVAETGHLVTGIDWSVAMLARAGQAEAVIYPSTRDRRTRRAAFRASFDVVLRRHVLWALPELVRVLQRWAGCCSGGRPGSFTEGYRMAVDYMPANCPALSPFLREF